MIDFLIRRLLASWFFPFLTAAEDSGMTYLVYLVEKLLCRRLRYCLSFCQFDARVNKIHRDLDSS